MPAAPSDDAGRFMEGKGVVVRLDQSVTEDAQGVPHTEATVHVTGAMTEDFALNDFGLQGELRYVNPQTYPVYAEQENKPEIIAIFTSWFAGFGHEVRLSLDPQNYFLMLEIREGDETNDCTPWELLHTFVLPQDTVVDVEHSGAPIQQSSLSFCDQQ